MTPWLRRAAAEASALCALAALLAALGLPAPALGRPVPALAAVDRPARASAPPPADAAAAGPGATTPSRTAGDAGQAAPMGWSSWNSFASSIDAATIRAQTDALVAAGLPEAGYRYVDIDEGWWEGARDAAGDITVDAGRWPGGMGAVADYIHGKGLKAGIYTDAGRDGCGYHYPTTRPAAPNTGLEGHELQDAIQFERWGFDLVKVDWCGGQAEHLDPQSTYSRISAAVDRATAVTGHPMLLSVCEWGVGRPWNWGAGTAAMWRTGGDLVLWGERPSPARILAGFDANLHPTAQHTGAFNDPDMLTAGLDGLTDAQTRTHLALWALAGAPLLAGNDLTRMTPATRAALTNPGMIAVDQDARGLQGVRTAEDSPGLQVYGKVLDGPGRRAVLLLNRTTAAAPITARWAALGLTAAPAAVRDVWTDTALGDPADGYTASVPAGGSVLLTVTGTDSPATSYEAEAGTPGGPAAVTGCATCSGGAAVTTLGGGADVTLGGVRAGAAGLQLAELAYVNRDPGRRTATLQVNGQAPTVISFPPTGDSPGTVSVLLSLARGSANTLTFGNPDGAAPDLDAVRLRPIEGTDGTALTGAASGRCAELPDSAVAEGSRLALRTCDGGTNQTFTATARGELVVYGTRCLDVLEPDAADGSEAVIESCTGAAQQQWSARSDGSLANRLSGLCLGTAERGTADGTPLGLQVCDGGTHQRWVLDPG